MANGDKIKGLTVKIGADTSDFVKELKKVDKEINATQKSANNLQKGLELKYDESRFLQAQKKIQQALTETEQKADAIRKQMKHLEDSGQVDTTAYDTLQNELAQTETKALQLENQLKKLEDVKFKSLTKGLDDVSKGLDTAANKTKIFSAAAAGALVGAAALAKSTAATGAELQDYSDRLGISAEALQRWQYIAMQSGVSNEQLNKAFSKSRDVVGTALAGATNTATNALQTLVGDLSKIPSSTEGAFDYIIKALAQVSDKTQQAYYANEIFGEKLATDLIPMLNNGADKLNQLNQEFESIGYLSNEQVQNLADLDDKLNIVNAQLDLAKAELGIALVPILDTLNDLLVNDIIPAIKKLAEWFNGLSERGQKFVVVGLLMAAALSPVLKLMSSLIGVIPKLIKFLGSLQGAALKTTAGFAALGTAFVLCLDLIANWKNMSTIEKILKSLAVAALVAAAAVAVFHAAWSWGIAVGAIAAGITAAIATVKAASDEIGVDTDFSDVDSLTTSAGESSPRSYGGGSTTYNEDNSQYNISISMDASGDLNYDSKALAEEVIKQIQIKKQAGRG